MSIVADHFWTGIASATFDNEGSVETRLILPLLRALGYSETEDISPKHTVVFQTGRKGRPHEADFAVFAARPHSRSTSLMAIEVKRPGEDLRDGRAQGESYAANLRSPILLLTNGIRLEIWQVQIATESECALACDVVNLYAHRGVIEGLIGKEALVAHCKSLVSKSFDLLARDLAAYETAEFERNSGEEVAIIARRLIQSQSSHRELTSSALLQECASGAIIAGASGHGKTTLCGELRRQAIERRWSREDSRLPIEMFLPDYHQSNVALSTFLTTRIAAHCAHFTEAALRECLRSDGILLLCDGFDRLSAEGRASVEATIAVFKRDSPRSQVFVLTGLSARAERLGLPVLELPGYNDDEQREVVEAFARDHNSLRLHWNETPRFLKEIAEHPILLELVLSSYRDQGRYPTSIVPLFEAWLDRILPPTFPMAQRVDMRRILTLISNKTFAGPISEARAVSIVRNSNLPEAFLDELTQRDAFSRRGATLEIRHEMLADYLRSLDVMEGSPEQAADRIAQLPLRDGSQLPVLLMACATTSETQDLVWSAAVKAGVRIAISALRFRADRSDEFALDSIEASHRYLSEVLEGLEEPLALHFPKLAGIAKSKLAARDVSILGVVGSLENNGSWVSYSFRPVERPQDRIVIGHDRDAVRWFGKNLQLSGLRTDSGRVLGMELLKDELLSVIKERNLDGGPVWREELSRSRIRYLIRDERIRGLEDISLSALEPRLSALAAERDGVWFAGSRWRFKIDDLRRDIGQLIADGVTEFGPLWERTERLNLSEDSDRQRVRDLLDNYFRRMQLTYSELVETNFAEVSSKLSFYQVLPIRYHIRIRPRFSSLYREAGMVWSWIPVSTFDEAGADVTFDDESPDFATLRAQASVRHAEIERELSRLNRLAPDMRYSEGWSSLPNFSTSSTREYGKAYETKIARSAIKRLAEDIRHLFRELDTTN